MRKLVQSLNQAVEPFRCHRRKHIVPSAFQRPKYLLNRFGAVQEGVKKKLSAAFAGHVLNKVGDFSRRRVCLTAEGTKRRDLLLSVADVFKLFVAQCGNTAGRSRGLIGQLVQRLGQNISCQPTL